MQCVFLRVRLVIFCRLHVLDGAIRGQGSATNPHIKGLLRLTGVQCETRNVNPAVHADWTVLPKNLGDVCIKTEIIPCKGKPGICFTRLKSFRAVQIKIDHFVPQMTLKQYIFLRSDLKDFNKGALVAQACHATTYATFTYLAHQDTQEYLNNMAEMHKVVLKISGHNLGELVEALDLFKIEYVEWVESPENVVTCICTRPFSPEEYPELLVYMRKYRLF